MASIRTLLRASCSHSLGTGHLRRCLTLAEVLLKRGWRVCVLTDDNATARAIGGLQRQIDIRYVGQDCLCPPELESVHVLVVDVPQTDEQLTLHPDWVRQLRRVDRAGTSVVSLGHVSSNSSCFRAVIDLYPSRTVHAVNYLEGPEYLILRPEFVSGRPLAAPDGRIPRIIIAMGGSDPKDLTQLALAALAVNGVEATIDLVLGAGYGGNEEALARLARDAGLETTVHRELGAAEVVGLMQRASLGIVAFGTTAYELMALGRPTCAFTHYLWQEGSAHRFEQMGAIRYLGCAETPPLSNVIGERVKALLAQSAERDQLGERGRQLIDGRGAIRVADLLETYAMETTERQLDILFVVAHPGDELLGAGATLIRHLRGGARVGLVVLGEGVASRWDTAEHSADRETAQQGLKSALQLVVDRLGLHAWYYYRFEDNRFDSHDLLDLVKVVETVVGRHQPHTIYTHHPADLNVDHRLTYEAVVTALRPQSNCPVKTLFSIETPSSTDWGAGLGHGSFVPNWFEAVDATLDDKMELLQIYGSELRPDPHPRSLEGIRDQAAYWGRRAGIGRAEAFVLQRHIASALAAGVPAAINSTQDNDE